MKYFTIVTVTISVILFVFVLGLYVWLIAGSAYCISIAEQYKLQTVYTMVDMNEKTFATCYVQQKNGRWLEANEFLELEKINK